MLDMWLPILDSLRGKLRDAEFVFLVPQGRQIGVLDLQNVLFTIADQIFDSVMYPSVTGHWKRAKSLAEAQDSHESESLVRIWRLVKQHNLAVLLRRLIAITLRLTTTRRSPKPNSPTSNALTELLDGESVVLFNISEVDKPYMAQMAKSLASEIPKFSMYHGVKLASRPVAGERVASKFDSSNTIKLLFSTREARTYMESFGIQKKDLRVVGIPRHEDKWIVRLASFYRSEERALPSRYIFVISRPANEYVAFSWAHKVEALRSIGEAARRNDLHILIKLHPKEEQDDGTAAEALGLENFGKTWSYTNTHSLVLGKHCEFAVSYFSSVAMDMAKIGTPVIEYLDWKIGMPSDVAWPYYFDGEPVSIISHLGFSLPASSRTQFLNHVDRIISDRASSVEKSRESYKSVFPEIEGISDKIAGEIVAVMTGKDYPIYGQDLSKSG